jgi:hypothetical protein
MENLEYIAPLGMSDHYGIFWKHNCSTQMVNDRNEKRLANFKGDYYNCLKTCDLVGNYQKA